MKAYVCCSKCGKPVHMLSLPANRKIEDTQKGYEGRTLLRCPHQDCKAENVPYKVTDELPDSIHS